MFKIQGERTLSGGKVTVAGSSNQVTKCMIASLLTTEPIIIHNCPHVHERSVIENLLSYLGTTVERLDENTIRLQTIEIIEDTLTKKLCEKNRLAILTVGPILHRMQKFNLAAALGGDKIGARPVNFHINGIRSMGAQVSLEDGIYRFSRAESLYGTHISLPFPSVMTTENLVLCAVLAKGRTVIENAATEPEIIELIKMLQKMGADIMVNSHRTIVIQGVEKLRGCEITIMPDRNEAVSLAVAALATGGDVLLSKMPHDPIYSFLNYVQRMGATFKESSEGIFIQAPKYLEGTHIEVEVHPGFMTDWQQPFMVLFTQAKGISILHETIFEERLKYTEYLKSMGASITTSSKCLGEAPCRFKHQNHIHSAIIQGPTPLQAMNFDLPTDIRAGMCLVVAGLVAAGTTYLNNIQEIQRKYDKLVPKLQEMGADISLVD
jgi:UDP-N-acetylglucosamine 1-carboxyvinyltransferase